MSAPRKGQSRPATGRPRKIAGRSVEPVEDPAVGPDPVVEQGGGPAPGVETATGDDGGFEASSARPSTGGESSATAGTSATEGGGSRTAWILVAVIAVLALVGI